MDKTTFYKQYLMHKWQRAQLEKQAPRRYAKDCASSNGHFRQFWPLS